MASIRTAGLRSSPYAGPLQAYLAEASQWVRPAFHGPLTYASIPFEVVDWSLFDVIGVDHYRNSKVDDHRYAETIRRYLGEGKPVVNSEFGHSPYRGDCPGYMEFGEPAATHSGRAAEPGAPSPPVRVDYQKES